MKTQEARSGDPAIRRSGDPAIRRSGDPAIRRSGIIPRGIPSALVNPCTKQFFARPAMAASAAHSARTLYRPSLNMVIAISPNLSPGLPVRTVRKSAERRLFRLPYRMPNTERRQGSRAFVKSAHTCIHYTTTAMPLPLSAATEPPTAAPISCMTMQAAAPSPSTEIPADSGRPLSPYRAPSLSASAVVVARRLAAHASRSDLRYRTRLPKR